MMVLAYLDYDATTPVDPHVLEAMRPFFSEDFGKIAVTADRAPQHRSKLVKEFLRNNKDVRMIYLPKGSPYLNAMEECWHQGKRVLLVSEYYKTFQDMHRAVSLYYRTARFKLYILKFTSRKYLTLCTNF